MVVVAGFISLPATQAQTGPPSDGLPDDTTQLVVVTAKRWHSSYARLRAWDRNPHGWNLVLKTRARVGANGMARATRRKQNTLTTPAGTFAFLHAFGIAPAPRGTRIPYLRVTGLDYWVYDPKDPRTYNRWVVGRSPAARWRLSEAEHLIGYRREYQYAVIIDYNRASGLGQPDTTAGGGIFLHVNGEGPTAGCVSVPKSKMVRLLQWLQPSANARIVIRVR